MLKWLFTFHTCTDGPAFAKPDGPTEQYVLLGDRFSLICGTGLDSNPPATITWTAPDGTTIIDNSRYDLDNGPDVVKLNFRHTILSDAGIWCCTVSVVSEQHIVNNGKLILMNPTVIGTPIEYNIHLTVIGELYYIVLILSLLLIYFFTVPPSQPRNITIQNIGTTWASISWDPPLMAEFPVSCYDILAQAVDLHTLNRTTANNSTFFNVTGPLPGTTHELTVVAVSQGGDVVARSQPSNCIQGTTAVIGKTVEPIIMIMALFN